MTCLLAICAFLPAFGQSSRYVPHEVLVRFDKDVHVSEFLDHFARKVDGLAIERQKLIAPYMNIWQISYQGPYQPPRVAALLQNYPEVLAAQVNHRLQKRTTPNDPYFSQQWQWQNVAAEAAWDVTTGGVTAAGDTIVVAIIDDGTTLNHPDLAPNIWHNYAEIPDNGIDDDNNGYVDDFNGWNIINNNNNVNSGSHGVEVAGMVGAAGNNNSQGTGMNWNVKLMTIVGGTAQEAEVIQSYSYALAFRRKYNQTNGAEGAFVVATNSSWGQDFGNPNSAPLWCQFYDTLGVNGILSCAATSNQAYDVDQQGDLPTGCTSEYLITVTATDINDARTFSAWGINSIDLGAPGDNIYTTASGGDYTTTSGTSFSSPLTAGVVALLYSAPCPTLAALAKSNPAAAAILVRDYIFNGVDTTSQLMSETKTGGRINAAKALDNLMAQCGDCVPPFSINAQNITDTGAEIHYVASTDSVLLYYHQVGANTWDTISFAANPQMLTGLQTCTDYEVIMQTMCGDSLSEMSAAYTFKTDGCCENPASVSVSNITPTSAMVQWDAVLAATAYKLIYAVTPFTTWDTLTVQNNSVQLSLDSCSVYQVAVQTICDMNLPFTNPVQFATTGCGSCEDLDYCQAASDDNTDEWLDTVAVSGVFSNGTGASADGYAFYPNENITLLKGIAYTMHIVPGYDGFDFGEAVRVWIDLNQNGSFDADELLIDPDFTINEATDFPFTIPASALTGNTRMRVMMKYGSPGEACDTISFGEIEDYCVFIDNPNGCLVPLNVTTSNFAPNSVQISFDQYNDGAVIYYRPQGSNQWQSVENVTSPYTLTGLDECTDYEVAVRAICGDSLSDWSTIVPFKTYGCGACYDYSYCASKGNPADEWLEELDVTGVFTNSSGPSTDGYAEFTDMDITFTQGETYTMTATPGYSGTDYQEHLYGWIDYNQDGSFDSTEMIVPFDTSFNVPVSFDFTVPDDAVPGLTRMRIILSYSGNMTACGTYSYGETEDYCVTIKSSEYCLGPDTVQVSNIGYYSADLSWAAVDSSISYVVRYRPAGASNWESVSTANNGYSLSNLDECTDYEVEVQAVCANGTGNKATTTFKTECIMSVLTAFGKGAVTVQPNPFDDAFDVVFTKDLGDFRLVLTDAQGRPVPATVTRHQRYLTVTPGESLPAGLYLIKVSTDRNTGVYKVVKQ